jgi:hypothetical protein
MTSAIIVAPSTVKPSRCRCVGSGSRAAFGTAGCGRDTGDLDEGIRKG